MKLTPWMQPLKLDWSDQTLPIHKEPKNIGYRSNRHGRLGGKRNSRAAYRRENGRTNTAACWRCCGIKCNSPASVSGPFRRSLIRLSCFPVICRTWIRKKTCLSVITQGYLGYLSYPDNQEISYEVMIEIFNQRLIQKAVCELIRSC